jgi:hypothetical protein
VNALLDAICSTSDELEQLEAALADHGPLLDGARGQKVLNPALTGITRHRALLSRLLADAFPEEGVEQKRRRAARKRWDGVRMPNTG